MKTSELTGAALDYAVARSEGFDLRYHEGEADFYCGSREANWCFLESEFSPSTYWAQGGLIIEREGLTVAPASSILWAATSAPGNCTKLGKTPLIAAMRCYVASKLGSEVDIPEQLCK